MQKELKPVKLSDIAEELNISVVSVSNALSGKKGVSDELRQRVFDMAEELGYRRVSRESERKRLPVRTIGVVISERYIRKTGLSFYMRIYQELVLAASRKNSITLLEILKRADEDGLVIPELLYNESADGIIVLGELKHPYTRLLRDKSSRPILFMDCYEDIPDTDFIISDSFNGMCSMTRLLIREGYRKIGFIGRTAVTSSITDRYLGYRKALLEAGIEINRDWVIEAQRRPDDTGDMIVLPDPLPEAFACYNDQTARLLTETLWREGLRVPGDIGVVGFDNYLADSAEGLSLTTYDVDIRAMSEIAVNTLIRKLEHTHFVPRLRVVKGSVVMGSSHKREVTADE